MRLILVPLLVAALGIQPAIADAITLVGMLDGRKILVELTEPGAGAIAGRYTFATTGGDVPLVPVSHDGGLWVLNEEAPCGEDDCETDFEGKAARAPLAAVWELRYDADAQIARGVRRTLDDTGGEKALELIAIAWRALEGDEKPSAFALHDRSVRAYYSEDFDMDWRTMPYEMALLDVPLDQGETLELAGGVQYRFVTDPRTKFAFPRAVTFAQGEPVEAINAILSRRHYQLSLGALDCLAFRYASYGMSEGMNFMGGTLGDFDNESVSLSFLSPRVVSWTQAGSLWCSGAHPYNHYNSFNFDIATGAPLPLNRVFSGWVPREWGAAPGEIADADLAAQNPAEYIWGPSPALISYIRANIPADVLTGDPELDDACYSDEALASHAYIRFAAPLNAVFTVSGFPHVLSMCSTDLFSVPLTALGEFLGPDADAYFPELGG